jgi:hypothetical protein
MSASYEAKKEVEEFFREDMGKTGEIFDFIKAIENLGECPAALLFSDLEIAKIFHAVATDQAQSWIEDAMDRGDSDSVSDYERMMPMQKRIREIIKKLS